VSRARAAARSLDLQSAEFIEGDIRRDLLPPADVYYMYSPLMDSTGVAARLAARAVPGRTLLFSQALDVRRLPWRPAGSAGSYWLRMYVAEERALG